MKYLFLIVLIFSLENAAFAQDSNFPVSYASGYTKSNLNLGTPQSYQPFISKGKQWKIVEEHHLTGVSMGGFYSVSNFYFKGDTIIENTAYSLLYSKLVQPVPDREWLTYPIHEDTVAQKVYLLDFAFHKTTLLYDFKLNKGDEFNIHLFSDYFEKHTVVKVDTILSYNKRLKRIVFDDSTTWIEGVGSVYGRMIPFYGEMICVSKNNELFYMNSKYNNCDTIFTQGPGDNIQTINSNEVMVFPNPIVSTSVVRVHSNSHEPFKIEIYNYSGALVKEDFFSDNYSIGLLQLTKGLYVYRIVRNNHVIKMDKIIVVNQYH